MKVVGKPAPRAVTNSRGFKMNHGNMVMPGTERRMTIQEMEDKYPNQWLFIVDCVINPETTQLVSGIVTVWSPSRRDVDKASGEYVGNAAIHYTGEIPKDRMYLL